MLFPPNSPDSRPPPYLLALQAVLLAQTPLIAMLDADMVVSRTLAEALSDPADAEV